MPAFSASAPGKAILFGEHAVVYGQPAIAIPVNQAKVKVYIFPNPAAPSGEIEIEAPEIGLHTFLTSLSEDHPLNKLLFLILQILRIQKSPAFHMKIVSTIPVAAGMGSGAAVSVAISRAVSTFLGSPFSDEVVSNIAFEIEKLHHGTPSGIDNTVIAFGRPIYFIKEKPFEIVNTIQPLHLILGDSGIISSTKKVVDEVRRGWYADPYKYENIFQSIGNISLHARQILEYGPIPELGELMNQNHELLRQINVSCPEIDHLVDVALKAGAYGAKVSGAGQGGNMIALINSDQVEQISRALKQTGARSTISTELKPFKPGG